MEGPIPATISAGLESYCFFIASIVAVATSRTVPIQPACATPTTPLRGSCTRIGTQSAKRMYNVNSGLSVRIISACRTDSLSGRGAVAHTTSAPCTCQTSNTDSGAHPNASRDKLRLAQTRVESSPTVPPTFNEFHRSALETPCRVQIAWCAFKLLN